MISKIGVENRNLNSNNTSIPEKSKTMSNPNFKGGALWALALQGIQECEKNPMINVAVIDMLSAILPRTIVESMTNWFAGFEAFRRESSGLVVNCLIPSFLTMGVAAAFNKFVMPKGANLSSCWADSKLIQHISDLYQNSTANDKVKDSLKEIIKNINGVEGNKNLSFKDILTEEEIDKYADDLSKLAKSDTKNKNLSKAVKNISKEIADKTHIYTDINVTNGNKSIKTSNINSLLENTVKYFKQYQKVENSLSITEFAEKGKKLVKMKSIGGLLIVLPLAASMQYINRWITGKISGTKGAPIYDDFGKCEKNCIENEDKKGLLKQKIISISSMIGVALLSMMKKPSFEMLEFKGIFPTMDQARIISTTTFASRMAAADDKNELAEATVRDIATFGSLYFLGDYAAKAVATMIEKQKGIKLLNDTKPIKEDANILQKFWHWVKNVNIKSSEEVVSKLAQELKEQGKTPTKEQLTQITKELKQATNYRSYCQLSNLGVSLLLLGLIIPICTRQNTKRKHEQALKLAEQNINLSSNTNTSSTGSTMVPAATSCVA